MHGDIVKGSTQGSSGGEAPWRSSAWVRYSVPAASPAAGPDGKKKLNNKRDFRRYLFGPGAPAEGAVTVRVSVVGVRDHVC